MRRALYRSARERFTARRLLGLAAFVAVLYAFLGYTVDGIVGVCIGLAAVELVGVATDASAVPDRHVKTGLGAVVLVGSVALAVAFARTGDGALWLPACTFLAGAWFLADAAADARTGSTPDPLSDVDSRSDVMATLQDANRVTTALEDEPLTHDALHDACDLDADRIDDALAIGTDRGIVVRDGETYRLDRSELGIDAFLRGLVVAPLRRVVRPARVLLG
ncbi:hypothetical protein [Halorubellus sp. PRR65]|uniref:hypothetical protein n=1 Tax=Halorubellus sp. PRR65 TaxID=3098148 RepID=UPI002B2612C9|nr:hypothetical protein [Halorubellus sp. PRR65]